jgi:hypothetical protein
LKFLHKKKQAKKTDAKLAQKSGKNLFEKSTKISQKSEKSRKLRLFSQDA